MPNAFLTELDAVNDMLSAIGEQPVNSLTGTLPADALMAKTLLNRTSLRTQSQGWFFNTEQNVELTADSSGIIALPPEIIRIDALLGDHSGSDFIIKDRKIYDLLKRSFDLGANKTLTLTVIYFYEFSNLPVEAQGYIIARASRLYQTHAIGSPRLDGLLLRDEGMAKAELETYETEQGDYNTLRSPGASRVLAYRISPLNRMHF